VRVVFDVNGNVIGRMDYDPFGAPLSSGNGLPSRGYAGLFRDGEAGLDFAQARSYQVRTGRFSTIDPIYAGLFEPQAWNRYAYALNAPISYTDASGLLAEPFRSTNNPLCETFPAMCKKETQGDGDVGGGGPSLSMLLFLGGLPFGGSGSSGFEPTPRGGRGSNPGQTQAPGRTPNADPTGDPGPNPSSTNCTIYVETVSEMVEKSGLTFSITGQVLAQIGFADAMQQPAGGFKDYLTTHGQGNDVYKHFNFVVGSMLEGKPGNAAGLAAVDVVEALVKTGRPRRQALVELRNDWEAFKVGIHALRAVVPRDFQRFERTVEKQICQ
jgi:RHS repeat-associated protein